MTEQPLAVTSTSDMLDYKQALILSEDEIHRILTSSPKIVREYTSHLAVSKGKGIRSSALLASAMDDHGKIHPDAVLMAAAIEIIHLATLVHDDVIDDANTRRGIPTLQKKYGKRTAVICGDYLLCAALGAVSAISKPDSSFGKILINDISRVCLGELNQHLNNANLSLSVYKYLKIISGKTAALFEATFAAGCLLLPREKDNFSQYRRLGKYIGMIFQLKDDCNDFEQSENTAKKPVHSDYDQGVITLPLIIALQDQKVSDKLASDNITGDEINLIVKKSNGLSFTHALATKYYHKSKRIIKAMNFPAEKEMLISSILDLSYFGKDAVQVNL